MSPTGSLPGGSNSRGELMARLPSAEPSRSASSECTRTSSDSARHGSEEAERHIAMTAISADAFHNTERYANNRTVCDQGRLKARTARDSRPQDRNLLPGWSSSATRSCSAPAAATTYSASTPTSPTGSGGARRTQPDDLITVQLASAPTRAGRSNNATEPSSEVPAGAFGPGGPRMLGLV